MRYVQTYKIIYIQVYTFLLLIVCVCAGMGIYYVNIRIHHGGVFTYKNRIRLYEEGKVELVYCQSIDTICLDSCKDLVEKRLGYENYKIYWHKEGESLDNCQLLWSEYIVNDMCTYATKTGTLSFMLIMLVKM